MNKIIKSLLTVVLFFSLFQVKVYADQINYASVLCASNNIELFNTYMITDSNKLYAKISDIVKITDWEIGDNSENNKVYLQKKIHAEPDIAYRHFIAGFKEAKGVNKYIFDDTEYCDLIEVTDALNIEIIQNENCFYFVCPTYTVNELYCITDQIINSYPYKINYNRESFNSKYGVVGSFLYDLFIKMDFIDYDFWTKSDKDEYRSIFKNITQSNLGDLYALYKNYDSLNKALKYYDRLGQIEVEENLYMLTDKTKSDILKNISDNSKLSTYLKFIKITSDPTDELLNKVLEEEQSKLKLAGLDISSQLKILDYAKSVTGCSLMSANIINYTFTDHALSNCNIPNTFKDIINDFKSVYSNENIKDVLNFTINEEIYTVSTSIAEKSVEEIIKLGCPPYELYKICAWVTDTIASKCFNFDNAKEFVDKAPLLNDLQTCLYSIYDNYRYSNNYAINTKYTTLMYLDTVKQYYEMLNNYLSSDSTVYKNCLEDMSLLMSIEDRDITFIGNNVIDMSPIIENIVDADIVPKEHSIDLSKAVVGSIITLGKYKTINGSDYSNCMKYITEQDIEWIVLEMQKDRALVISKYILDYDQFNGYADENNNIPGIWRISSLREWLNNYFYKNAFSQNEKELILLSDIEAPTNPVYIRDIDISTQDRVFLLNINQANEYFKTNEDRRTEEKTSWWLASPGGKLGDYTYEDNASCVTSTGEVDVYGYSTMYPCGVRPCMWLKIN